MKKILSKLKDQKGQSLVEFTLVLVFVFLPILFGITEFSRAFYHADLLKGEANIAARAYAVGGASAGNAARDSLTTIAQARDNRTIFILFTADTSSVTARAMETFQSPFFDQVMDLLQMWLGGSRPHIFPMSLTRTATYRLES
jgi:Flp pilus assembly protein TadG